jgi:hypothetical protein
VALRGRPGTGAFRPLGRSGRGPALATGQRARFGHQCGDRSVIFEHQIRRLQPPVEQG